ncbi:glutamate racemase [Insolitispirillum peregrinum]|uniref:Glutamate racemase n=1 Tax=Insolitispirillum peregrinum TaxID=80876 RepID=A0A1N7MVZ9_9PROT|nr:glutamate racemase [Insolitispirillum peregrinum]SIS90039.1 glutamate racemase [Insolitispirillum peregrinum]
MARVAVFDSGLGGVSVLAAIRDALPPATRYSYCADGAFFPYGPRSEAEIEARVRAVIHALLRHETDRPDVVVIACNTASTAALAAVRADHPQMPFVGVVPAIKPAASLSKSRVIGLLATPGTVRRAYSDQLIRQFAADCVVVRHGAQKLADLAEQVVARGGVQQAADLRPAVEAEIAPLFTDHRLDTVVLGCTHYPLVRHWLSEAAPWPVTWLDSGEAVARQVLRVLPADSLTRPEQGGSHSWNTAASVGFTAAMMAMGLGKPHVLPVQPALTGHGG